MLFRLENCCSPKTALLTLLLLLTIPALASAQVVDPGGLLENLASSAFDTDCALADPDCDTLADLAASNASMQVFSTSTTVARFGSLSAGFSVSGDGEAPLLGSMLSVDVSALGVLDAIDSDPATAAGYRLDLVVFDETAGVAIAAVKIDQQNSTGGVVNIDLDDALVVPLSLTTGHTYSVSLTATAIAKGALGMKGAVDLFSSGGFFGWAAMTIQAGTDPSSNEELEERVDTLETQVKALIAAVRKLRGDFDGHSHEYLTGKGVGHNNTVARTSIAGDDGPTPAPLPEPEPKRSDNRRNSNRRHR